jgi:GNAT superfamily N-acetyltransferase
MSTIPQSIGGEAVTTKLAMRMEDSLQAFAVRAACFIGELDVPYSEEFDGHDFGATHIIAYVGDEPVGALRVRWFQSFAMPERLAVIQRFRRHGIGQLLIERCRALAESRGSNMLYAQVLPTDVKYWEKTGWRRLIAEEASSGAKPIVGMVRTVDPSKPLPAAEAPESVALRREAELDASGMPLGTVSN